MTTSITMTALVECEQVIERGLTTFMEVGSALLRIRDDRLYREGYRDFEAYCQHRWSMGRARAYRLIEASQIVGQLSPIGDIPLPTTESQARELTGLDTEAAAAVMAEAHAITNGKPTAVVIKETRRRLTEPEPNPDEDEDDEDELLTPEEYAELLTEQQTLDEPEPEDPAPKEPKPRNRKSLPDAARDAGWELRRSVEKLDRLIQDDRFARNRAEVATQVRGQLTFTIESCQGLLDQLPPL